MSKRTEHITMRIEGFFLIAIGIAMVWFALFGNYEYLMNQKFRCLTVTGSALLICMGTVLLLSPGGRSGLSSLAAFTAIAAIVLVGKPYEHDVNFLTLPDRQGISGVPLTIGDTRYDFIGVQELNVSIVSGEEGYDGRRIVVTGLLKRTPELESRGQVAVMRPISVCCAADALMVGMRVEGSDDSTLTDQWVNIYGTIRSFDTPLPSPKIHHGAIRYSIVAESYLLSADSTEPYIRPKPKEGVMEKLASAKFRIFSMLAEKAKLDKMLEEQGMVTVLAPVDEAFDALPDGIVDELLEKGNRDSLVAFVGRHVLTGLLKDSDLRSMDEAETITGEIINVTMVNGKLRAEGSRFLFKNIEAGNGVIHAIYPAIIPAE